LSARTERRLLIGLLIAYALLACLYNIVMPLFEASDEQWHYPMVKYIADHGLTLPVQNPAHPGEWRQEGSQPPLYYMIGAVLTAGIDTSDLDTVRQVNPHADIGVIVPDGNVNMMMHDPARESFPWHGATLAVHLVRFLSVLLGGITVAMTFFLARELFPDLIWIGFGAAALTAFNPMFLFVSGSVNNDNLSNALASTLLVLLARLVKRRDPAPIRDLALIGVVAGAGMLAKFNIGFLLPLIALALALIAWRKRDIRPLLTGAAITGGLTILIGGWWYVRNWQLYGDPTGLNVFLQIVGSRPIVADMRQLWTERHSFLMSYWGFFGGMNVPLPDVVYTVFNAIAALSLVGVGAWFIGALTPNKAPDKAITDKAGLVPTKDRHGVKTGIALARLFTVVWIVVLFVSLLRWTSVTWASQGRLMFAAVAPISVWLAVGLWQLGRIAARIVPAIRLRPLGYTVGLLAITACFSAGVIRSTYQYAWDKNAGSTTNTSTDGLLSLADFYDAQSHEGITLALTAVDQRAAAGGYLTFTAVARLSSLADHFSHDWGAFIHVESEDGLIIAQRDVFLQQGLLATSHVTQWQADHTTLPWLNTFSVAIPDNVYTKDSAANPPRVIIGFYDLKTGRRMTLASYENTANSASTLLSLINPVSDTELGIGQVVIDPAQTDLAVPNPISANFNDQAELVGYDVSSLVMHPDHKVTLTLYWRAKQRISADYHVFVHVLDPSTTTIFGQDDSMPAAWARPTSTWQPGEIIKDEHTFTIHPDAAFGTWQIEVGLYALGPAGQIARLRLYTPDGGDANDQVYLSRVLIKPNYTYF